MGDFVHAHRVACAAQEPVRSCAARIASHPSSGVLSVLSVDVATKRTHIVWRAAGLPVGCTRLVPVPPPFGGFLVFSANAILWFSQHHYCGIALNG